MTNLKLHTFLKHAGCPRGEGVIKFGQFSPKGDDLLEVLQGYEERCGFPMCAGAIDGTHVPIIAPAESHIEYVNRKGFHSIVMQAVTDCNYMFRDVVIGWPGSVHDARVLSNSTIFRKGNEKRLFPTDLIKQICGVEMYFLSECIVICV